MKILLLFFVLFAIAGCDSDEKKKQRQDAAFDSCIDSYQSKCNRACDADPKFMYCAAKHGNNVIGSGCSAYMNGLSSTERVAECKRTACPVDYSAISACTKSSR